MPETMPSSPCRSRRHRNGFTLIELLVVVSIIALLVSILLPALNKAREQAKIAVCASNQHQLALSIQLYGYDYDGHLPGPPGYRANVLNYFYESKSDCYQLSYYCEAPDAFYCPSSKFQADTQTDPFNAPEETYFEFLSYGNVARYISYCSFISAMPYPGIYEDIPTRLDQPGSWVTFSDYDSYHEPTGLYWMSNHPANHGSYPESPPTKPDRWGINVATLDGAVNWRHEASTNNQYPIYGHVNIWWVRF